MMAEMIHTKCYDNALFVSEIVKLLNEGKTEVIFTINGRSMRPFIEHKRDSVVLSKANNIKEGDVVLAKSIEKGFVVHRLVKIDRKSKVCVLRGDGNLDMEHCFEKDVLAKAVAFVRKKKRQRVGVDSFQWKAYSWLWTHLLPVRRYLLALHRRLIIVN